MEEENEYAVPAASSSPATLIGKQQSLVTGDCLSRRKFLKRTGGATAAATLAWVATSNELMATEGEQDSFSFTAEGSVEAEEEE